MVATVLRLRWRVLGNQLSRSPWQLVGFILGCLAGLWALGGAVVGLIAIGVVGDLAVSQAVSVLGGAALLLGWLLGPVVAAGVDTTIDPGRLAPFPLSRRQVMAALVATGFTGIPGIITTLAALITAAMWLRWPAAAVVAVPCALVSTLTCVLATRLMATLSTGLGGNRRGREFVGTLVLIVLMLLGPIITGVIVLIDGAADLGVRIDAIVAGLGWTPLAAPWAIPGDVAAGAWGTAAARAAIAVATIIVLWLVWDASLRASTAKGGVSAGPARPRGLGLFGQLPTGAVGGSWARALTSWLRDPRYLRQLIMVPVLPVVFAFAGGIESGLFVASAPLVALILGFVGYADISYDGTAFTTVLGAGVRGRADRLGRTLGAACTGIPLIVLVAIVTVAVADAWAQLPLVLGAAVGTLLTGYGVCAVSSALVVMPVAQPGDSPFKTVQGQTFLMGLVTFGVWAVIALLAAPTLVLAVIGLVTGDALFGWLTLAVGVVLGAVVTTVGVLWGGRILDRTGPDLLARMKAFPG